MNAHPIVTPRDGYRMWAETWDGDPSAIVALESRHIAPWLADLRGRRVLDVSCGTGRWLAHAARQQADVLGVDFCVPMLAQAARKPGLHGRLVEADATRLPVPDAWADVVLCTLSLGHIAPVSAVMAEIARAARPGAVVIVSDFHPEAFRRGWKRTFRSGGQVYEIENHYYAVDELIECAARARLVLEDKLEPCFGEPERSIFHDAGKARMFEEVRGIPAVLIARWRKRA